MKAVLISNRRSHRNRRALARLHEIIEKAEGHITAYEMDGITGLSAILEQAAAQVPDILCINGGDGTIQAVISAIENKQYFAKRPLLCVLAGGRTNMLAGDLSSLAMPHKTLARLLPLLKGPREALKEKISHKSMIKLWPEGPDKEPVFGMFFGAAAIYQAILISKSTIHPLHLETNAATGLTLVWLVVKKAAAALLGKKTNDALFRAYPVGVTFSDRTQDKALQFFCLVTTLDRLILNCRPYWGEEKDGALRYTRVAYPPRGLLRWGWVLMYGSKKRKARLPAECYFSRNDRRISLTLEDPFTLDGEFFTPKPGVPIVLEESAPLAFLKP